MNDERLLDDRVAGRWLDRLADGELDESHRLRLMEWLDEDPIRWRSCALTLLESKEFERTIEDWAAASTLSAGDLVRPINGSTRSRNVASVTGANRRVDQRHWRSVSIAAIVAIAVFAAGMIVDRCWNTGSHLAGTGPGPRNHSPETELPNQDISADPVSTNQHPSASQAAPRHEAVSNSVSVLSDPSALSGHSTRPAMLPDYVRGQLERQGYRVNSEQKLVSVVLPDGEQMTIPVEEWKFQFAGNRVY